MEEQEDTGKEMILNDDYMLDGATNNFKLDYSDGEQSSADYSTNASQASPIVTETPEVQDQPNPVSTYLQDRLRHEKTNAFNPHGRVPPKVICYSELLHLQIKHKFSTSATTDILKWANISVQLEDNIFKETMWSQDKQIQEFHKYLGLQDSSFQFQETLVQWLPDNKPTVLWKQPFLDCVYELLTNDTLLGKNMENLSLPHPTDPFKSSLKPRPKVVSELHHGTWWQETFEDCCLPNSNDILCPLI